MYSTPGSETCQYAASKSRCMDSHDNGFTVGPATACKMEAMSLYEFGSADRRAERILLLVV